MEHVFDGLQIEVSREIHDRTVLSVEGADRRGRFDIALHQILEHRPMRRDVTVEIHAEKAGQLQKTGIDPPEGPGIAPGHRGYDRTLEPIERVCFGETIDL